MMYADGIQHPRRGALPEGGVLGSLDEREMIMAKKKNSRKALAVALGIMGIAGLSVASASSLPLTAGNEVAIGVDTFAPCDADGVNVGYTYAKNVTTLVYEIDEISITNINTDCNGQDIQFDLLDDADGPVVSGSGTVAAGAYTYPVSY